ncbi:MAG: amidohydrolase [Chloroflexi bacterium]|nr:amidohydrolase [Chloroflexota bacterium]MCH8087833.1 amidohydrolase [Chloroflexota bacterium]
MIIDFHAHIFPPHIQANRAPYLARDHTFSHLYSDPKARLSTADELVEKMDAWGIQVAVTVNMGWSVHEFCVETNDYILESARRFPDRLVPFCVVNPALGDRAVEEVERCAMLGARGIGELHSYAQGYRLDDSKVMGPVMEVVQRHGLIVLTHSSEPVGHDYPGKGTVTPEQLSGFINDFPDATIVCAHWGGGLPFYALMPEVRESLKNVYFDTAASPFLYTPQVFPTVVEAIGYEKILFGTDYPLISYKRLLGQVDGLGWPQHVKDGVLGGNGARLLGL